MRYFIWKSVRTLRMFATLYMARMFGTYRHSAWNGEFEYARYTWRGKDWAIPTGPFECPQATEAPHE